MKAKKVLLWDIDGTLLDFQAVEKKALQKCFDKFAFGVITDEMIERYRPINHRYWAALERGEMSKDTILVERFDEFLRLEGLDNTVAVEFNHEYQIQLGENFVFVKNGSKVTNFFKEKGFDQYAATNGTKVAQIGKLKNSGLDQIFTKAYISEEIGHEKPTSGFFDKIKEDLKEFSTEEMIMIGDSLTSDIKGGNDAGIDTVWFNPKCIDNKSGIKPTYEIRDLCELYEILGYSL